MSDLHLLTGAYALDALDDVERASFERHLRACGSCAAEVIEFQEAAAGLAARIASAPPPYLREQVLNQVAWTRQVPLGSALPSSHQAASFDQRAHPSGQQRNQRAQPVGQRGQPVRRSPIRRGLSVAAAAVLVAGSAGLAGLAWQAEQAAEEATIAARQEADRAAELIDLITDPRAIEASGAPSIGGYATVVAAGGRAVFAVTDLPAPPSGQRYQLWVIGQDTVIRSAGLLDLAEGSSQALVPEVTKGDTVAVSVEPIGGSPQPTTTPILAIPLT